MKLLLLSLLVSCSSFADFVYMEEQGEHKTIQLQSNGRISTLSEDQKLWALYPDISPNAQEFVFAEGPHGRDLHITYKNKKKDLTYRFHHPNKGMVLHPQFSKNTKYIFYSAPHADGKNTIYFFDFKAEVERQGNFVIDYFLKEVKALDEKEESYFPRPSSDAGFVVYQRNSQGKKEIVLFDRIENKKKVLTEGMSPALSLDERLIAFTSKKEGNWSIYTIDRFTNKITQVTFDEGDEMAPTFNARNQLAFASNKSGAFRLYEINAQGKWTQLAQASGQEVSHYSPQFSGEKKFKQSELAAYPGNPRSSFGSVVHEGKLYMAGGHQGAEHTYPPESFTNDLFAYNIETKVWKVLAPRPHKAHGFQMAAHGNYLYAFGGFAYSPNHKPRWQSLKVIDRYDIKNNKWEIIGELNSPRSSNVAVTIEDKVYLVGGWDSTPQKENDYEGRFHESIEIFNLESEKVEVAPFVMPRPLRRALTGVEYQGKIILVGGLGVGSTHFELVSHVTMIDPKDGLATELAPLAFPTFAPAAEVMNGELFVFGGMFKTGKMAYEYVSHIYGMDIAKNSWRHTGRYLKETKGFSQVFKLENKKLGILGGHRYFDGHDSPVATFETFANP